MTQITKYYSSNDAEWLEKARAMTNIECKDPTKTLQAPAEDCDINVLMKRMGVQDGSMLPRWTDPRQIYGDVSDIPDNPVEIAEQFRVAELSFMALPAELRSRFGNGHNLYNWVSNKDNHEEAIRIGLLHRAVLEEPDMTIKQLAETLAKKP